MQVARLPHRAAGLIVAVALCAGLIVSARPAHGLSYSPCSTGRPGFGATFWDPYYSPSPTVMASEVRTQLSVHDSTYIVDWSVDEDANNATWYPNGLGYPVFSDVIPKLINTLAASRASLWMGLVVGPGLSSANSNNWAWLETQVPMFERVADDLYRLYGKSITGWYIPSEPGESIVASYDNSYQYGAFLRQIDDYLHTHDGNRPVMIAPAMPSAIFNNLTPYQFVQQMQPMMAVAHMDIWDLQDGFGMTAWSAAQEAEGFSLARQYAQQYGSHIWADVYTPNNSAPAQWEPYLQALAPYSDTLSQWMFPQYLDPGDTADNPNAPAYFSAYRSYCGG